MQLISFLFYIWVLIEIFKVLLISLMCRYMKRKSKKEIYNKIHDLEIDSNSNASILQLWKKYLVNCASGLIVYNLNRLGTMPGNLLRIFFLKNIYCMDIDKNVLIHSHFNIRHPWNIYIGKGSIIGDYCYLDGRKGIYIGENVNLSTRVCIWTMQHDINDKYFRCNDKVGTVKIEDRAWLSCGTIILPKVCIGKGVVVAAGAVVSKNCEEFSVYGGIPAKKIGERNRELSYVFKPEDSLWFV